MNDSTLTRRNVSKNFVKSPFDSWYIGGILFLATVMFVLLYANYYRENMFRECWYNLLIRLGFIQLQEQDISHPTEASSPREYRTQTFLA